MPADQPPADDDARLAALVGATVRTLRERSGLSMRALATLAGISQPFLSTIERGLSTPSMATLYRIAGGLGVPPGDLLPGPSAGRVSVTRGAQAPLLPVSDAPDAAAGRALLMRPGSGLEVLDYRVEPGQHLGGWFASAGEMAVLVVSGSLDVEVAGVGTWRLEAGDLLHHPGQMPHRWLTVDGGGAHVLLLARRDPA